MISSAKFRIFIPTMINEERYKKLKEKYTDEEIAESFFIPADLTVEQRKAADEEMWAFRKKQLQSRTPQQKIYAGLLQICYQMKAYIESNLLDNEQSVAIYLRDYLRVTGKNQKQLAEDLGIHKTRLNRILNEKERHSRTCLSFGATFGRLNSCDLLVEIGAKGNRTRHSK